VFFLFPKGFEQMNCGNPGLELRCMQDGLNGAVSLMKTQ